MLQFLEQYGYLALLLGTFFEGETAILIASSLIHKGIFKLSYTVLFAFCGSLASDWTYYLIGRINGKYFIDRNPKLKTKIEPVTNLFHRYQLPVLLSYRFLYGFRIIIPIVIGMSGFKPFRFFFYSVVAGIFWATLVSTIGYFVGLFLDLSPSSFEENFFIVVLSFTAFGLLVGYIIKRVVSKNLQISP